MSLLQVGSAGIEAAWAGGKRGREVTDRFLPVVSKLLSKKGLFYLITIIENNPGEFTVVTRVVFKFRKLYLYKLLCIALSVQMKFWLYWHNVAWVERCAWAQEPETSDCLCCGSAGGSKREGRHSEMLDHAVSIWEEETTVHRYRIIFCYDISL